jgi:hypothetical protein
MSVHPAIWRLEADLFMVLAWFLPGQSRHDRRDTSTIVVTGTV